MYAIIETGGKQYRVEVGNILDVELLDTNPNGKVEFKHVLFVNNGTAIKIGAPHVAQSIVHAELIDEVKGPKVVVFKKFRRRKGLTRKNGHRQRYTRVKITNIVG